MIVEDVNLIKSSLEVTFIEEFFIGSDVRDFHEILHHIVVDLARRMCHVDSSLEISLLQEIGQTGTVINVEMCHQYQIDILGVNNVKVGQGLYAFLARVDPAVHEHFATFALNVDAGTADFISCTERSDLQEVTT